MNKEVNWKKAFKLDLVQAFPHGCVETMATTFAMVIAIKVYDFGTVEKIGIASASAIGFFMSLFIVPCVRRIGISVNWASLALWSIGALGFVLAGAGKGSGLFYLIGAMVAMMSLTLAAPLVSQIHRQLYPDRIRGTLFSIGGAVRASVAGVFAWLAGGWLDSHNQDYTYLFYFFAFCYLLKGITTVALEKVTLRKSHKLSLLDAFKHAGRDKAFSKLLSSWMLLGFGNLLCMALFVEYVTNPDFGFGYNSEKIALITTTIPMIVTIVMIVPWGIFFDKVPFYRLRLIVNVFFFAGILVYFLGGGLVSLCIGIALHAMGKSGGKVIWSLWVTRFAKAEHVSEYMSVHTFLTGVRGVLSPVFAFLVVDLLGPGAAQGIAISGAILILISSMMLMPEVLEEHREQATK